MSLHHEETARAFSTHDFSATYPRMSDDIVWNIMGGALLTGRDAVRTQCEESCAYLETVKTTFTQFDVLGGADFVVIDSRARYVDASGALSAVASCDIYKFAGELLSEITSYMVELPAG